MKKIGAMALSGALLLSACAGSAGEIRETEQEEGVAEYQTTQLPAEEIASASGEVFAMDTYMSLACYGEQCNEALEAAIAEIQRLDGLLSVGSEDSEISLLNANGGGSLSEETLIMVHQSLELWQTTEGSFDITIFPLMELWGFTSGDFAVPEEQELQILMDTVGSGSLQLDRQAGTLTLGQGQQIDLGGIAKGYTSDRVMAIFEEYDLVSGVVSLGGNVQCYGTKVDGSSWRVGIQDPLYADGGATYLGVLSVEDCAVITSGAYERYFIGEETGKTYHHILDPKSGYPANNGLISVTVVSKQGMLADGLSTACYVMGLEKSLEYWKIYGTDFDLILMTESGELFVTQGISRQFTSDYPVTVVEKEE